MNAVFWKQLDDLARPQTKVAVAALGWHLVEGGGRKWIAERNDHFTGCHERRFSATPDGLLAAIEQYEVWLKKQFEPWEWDEGEDP